MTGSVARIKPASQTDTIANRTPDMARPDIARPDIAPPDVAIELLESLGIADLNDLIDATIAAIEAGDGFGWMKPPTRETLERYWRGVLVVPERYLMVARVDGVICGAAQLVCPSRHNETQAFAATLLAHFVAPWAQRLGCGGKLLTAIETLARKKQFGVLNLDVRETQTAAIALYEKAGYVRWGTHPQYARSTVGQRIIAGHYYTKTLSSAAAG